MVGWLIAFGFRTPIFALFTKVLHLNDNLCEWCTLLSAAALEETLRLSLITFMDIRQDFAHIYWMGLGWAGSETAYYIAQSLLYSRWLADDNYRAVPTVASPTYEGYGAVTTSEELTSSVQNNGTKAVDDTRIGNVSNDDGDDDDDGEELEQHAHLHQLL